MKDLIVLTSCGQIRLKEKEDFEIEYLISLLKASVMPCVIFAGLTYAPVLEWLNLGTPEYPFVIMNSNICGWYVVDSEEQREAWEQDPDSWRKNG